MQAFPMSSTLGVNNNNMHGNKILVLVYFVYLCTFDITIVQSKECQLPENLSGRCMVIQDCPAMHKLLEKMSMSDDALDYIRKVHCGFVGRQPKVCCAITTKGRTSENLDLLPSREICGSQGQDRITNGVGTTIGEFTWMALLGYEKPNGRRFECGGSLINNRYVLTAAHCLLRIPKSWKLINVRLGEHNLDTQTDCEVDTEGFKECSDDPLDVTIEEQIPHELYDPNAASQFYDIALLRLSREIEFTDFIQPICLPLTQRLKNEYYIGKNLTITGWGKTQTRSQSNIKLKADVPIKCKAECESVYERYGVTLNSRQVCAGGVDSKDSCTGDSGGPLMALDRTESEENYIAYGIVSFGAAKCGTDHFPGIYTRVADYIYWITAHIKP